MSDQFNQQNQQGSQSGQSGGQNPGQQQQPKQKPGQGGQQGDGGQNNPNTVVARGAAYLAKRMSPDLISFYDASLGKQIEGSFVSDGKSIHVISAYGTKSAPYNDLGACIDLNAQILLARKLLSALARDDQQKPGQRQGGHREPMQKGEVGGGSDTGGGGRAV